MPAALTYPGVYIEEVPSGVRTITGVATSIAAFVGRAPRGPVNEAVPITSFGDFERIFGGLNIDSTMSYAVRDFYLNGGAEAIIVRLYQDPTGQNVATTAQLRWGNTADVQVDARSQGSWGSKLTATIDRNVATTLDAATTFNLTVRDTSPGGKTEKFLNVTGTEGARRVDRVLQQESQLVRWSGKDLNNQGALPTFPNAADITTKQTAVTAKQTDVTAKQQALDTAKQGGDQVAIDAAQAALDAAKTALTTAKADLNTVKAAESNATLLNATISDSAPLTTAYLPQNGLDQKKGIFALAQADLFNILCIPPDTREGDTLNTVYQAALAYCVARRAMLLVDSPKGWNTAPLTLLGAPAQSLSDLGLGGDDARNAAVYYPRVLQSDPLRDGQILDFVPCGIVAGVMARTDVRRGVWKAPAGLDASLNGTAGLSVKLTDLENGKLNQVGINCLRTFAAGGRVVWGARTMRGGDSFADEYKYVPVRRTALFIEESLYRGTQWVVFEPNDEPLWAQIRLNLGAFLHGLFRQGAFQGKDPKDAYFVRCDRTTTTQTDINLGIVNIIVGVALLRPAEFVVIKIQQIAGAIEA
jgi:phage tail sheath protein FI